MTLGEKLSVRRKAKNLTQDDVAQQLGVTPQAVSKWENDQSCPDIMLLPAIANLYETTVDDLLSREEVPVAVVVPAEKRKSIDSMALRILVEDGGDKVKVNLPLALVKIFMNTGFTQGISINGGNVDLSNIDWNAVITLVENGVIGRLIEVEEAGGATVIVEVV